MKKLWDESEKSYRRWSRRSDLPKPDSFPRTTPNLLRYSCKHLDRQRPARDLSGFCTGEVGLTFGLTMAKHQTMPQQYKARIQFIDADEVARKHVLNEWGEKAARHMHLADGFSIIAFHGETLVGMISTYWRKLPAPLADECDANIDILEVHKDFRRQGIARRLIEVSMERAKQEGMRQIRSWSSEDKIEAIQLWKALGFGLCPATTYPNGQEVKGFFVAKIL